jgi:hypothetical protein
MQEFSEFNLLLISLKLLIHRWAMSGKPTVLTLASVICIFIVFTPADTMHTPETSPES